MPIHLVTIDGVTPDPEVYGGLAAALSYVGAMFGKPPAAWRTLLPDDKARTLRAATLYLDQQAWDGERTGLTGADATTLQWPRSGIAGLDAAIVPPEIVQAAFELAVLIASDATVTSKADQGTNISSVNAGGGVGVTFFAPTSAAQGTATRMPVVVQRLVGRFLASASSSQGGFSQSGSCVSQFSRRKAYPVGGPQ